MSNCQICSQGISIEDINLVVETQQPPSLEMLRVCRAYKKNKCFPRVNKEHMTLLGTKFEEFYYSSINYNLFSIDKL
jgi:hypothetical protein